MNILIVGAGIAGPTLAYWLQRTGHRPTLVERAPALRRGGYLIDFWGAGFDVAEKMGLVPELLRRGYRIDEVREVDDDGKLRTSFDPGRLVEGAGGRYISLPRGELAAAIFDALGGEVETLFGEEVKAIETVETTDRVGAGVCAGVGAGVGEGAGEGPVRVTFASGATRSFDLVVGADGLHSRVRRLVFGEEAAFEKFLGIHVAAFDGEGYRGGDDHAVVMHAGVGYQITRVTMPDGATMFLFAFRDEEGADGSREADPHDVVAQKERLRARMRALGAGWETEAILDTLPRARSFYFDRVSQIQLPRWSSGRVALVGDAAACVSLLAGQGSALSMVEAYTLAASLASSGGDHAAAFASYERDLGPFLRDKQKAATRLAAAFAPKNALQLHLRNAVMRLLGVPFVADLAMGGSLRDAFTLPAMPAAITPSHPPLGSR